MTNNQINSKKLSLSKWTAVTPKNREKHFLVTKVIKAEDSELVVACLLEAVLTGREYQMDWRDLKDDSVWLPGWR